MKSLVLFIKGFIIGIGKIAPGISGSLLAVSLNIYELSISAIVNLFKKPKENIFFLATLASGIIFAILVFSNVILYFLKNHYVYTMILFIGLIFGSFFPVFSKTKINKLKDLVILFVSFFFLYFLEYTHSNIPFVAEHHFLSYLFIFFNGFIDAATMIIPGVSGTAIFMMIGSYDFVLAMYANPFSHLIYLSFFVLGLSVGIFFISKLISYCLNKKREELYLVIFGFAIYSLVFLIKMVLPEIIHHNIMIIILLFLSGSFFTKKLG